MKDPELRAAYDEKIFGWGYSRNSNPADDSESRTSGEESTNAEQTSKWQAKSTSECDTDKSNEPPSGTESSESGGAYSTGGNQSGWGQSEDRRNRTQTNRRDQSRSGWRGSFRILAFAILAIAVIAGIALSGETEKSAAKSESTSVYTGTRIHADGSKYITFVCPDEWDEMSADDGTVYYGMPEQDDSAFAVYLYYSVVDTDEGYEDLDANGSAVWNLYDEIDEAGAEILEWGNLTDTDGEDVAYFVCRQDGTISELCIANSRAESKTILMYFIYTNYNNTEQQELVKAIVNSVDCKP